MNENITPPFALPIWLDDEGTLVDARDEVIAEAMFYHEGADTYIVEACNAYPALTARVKELEEALDLVESLASREWQEADGSRKAAKDNSGKLLWFVSDDVMQSARAALNKEPTT